MNVSKVGGFTKISQMAGCFQNRIAGDRRPLVAKKARKSCPSQQGNRFASFHLSTMGAPSHNNVSSQDCCFKPCGDSEKANAEQVHFVTTKQFVNEL